MCLYPKLILNRKYLPNKSNGGIPPPLLDKRTIYVPVGCGKCMECMKQKARNWNIRLQEEIRTDDTGVFVTLTFSNESLSELAAECDSTGYKLDNDIVTLAFKRFRERWRKKYKKSIKHWIVSELGHGTTEHVHLHGILFTKEKEDISKLWQYGYSFLGTYVNSKTINYISKYIHKIDHQHKYYKPIVLVSPGIGSKYIDRLDSKGNEFRNEQTNELYKNREGYSMNLPVYYRNKLYTDEEREKLWLYKLDKQVRYINGIKIDISQGYDSYYKILANARRSNRELGYGDDSRDWEQEDIS